MNNDKVNSVREACICVVDGSRGIYVPQQFVKQFYGDGSELTHSLRDEDGEQIGELDDHKFLEECLSDCMDAENRYYWDSWTVITDRIYLAKQTENEMGEELYMLYQNDDLWAIPMDAVATLDEEEQEEFWNSFC